MKELSAINALKKWLTTGNPT